MFKSSSIELLKLIAIFTMFIDHSNIILHIDSYYLYLIGRLAFPIFAFVLIHNYIFYSKDKLKYIERLFLLAIISQLIFQTVNPMTLNIVFNLFFVLLYIYIFENFVKESIIKFILLNISILAIAPFIDYGYIGIFFVLSIYFALKKGRWFYILPLLCLTQLSSNANIVVSLVSLLSVIIIYISYKIDFNIKRLNKWFFYLFYPLHLLYLKFIIL